MAYIDNELIFCQDKSITAAVSPATTSETLSDVIDLGTNGPVLHPLFIDVKLPTPFTAGNISKITLQSSAVANDFSAAVDEMAVIPPATQTSTMTLAQFYAPIKTGNRYVRLKFDGASSPAGGKVTAFMTPGATVV